MYLGVNTWNLRDTHMTETLAAVLQHLSTHLKNSRDAQGSSVHIEPPKAVVWAHNSHLGDASFTESSRSGEGNVGQYTRHMFGLENTYSIGFSTFTGTVTAANNWDEPGKTMKVRPAEEESYENMFHQVGVPNFCLRFRANPGSPGLTRAEEEFAEALKGVQRTERAIGVLYRPASEKTSHMFKAKLSQQFDCLIHLDTTSALTPIDVGVGTRDISDAPETFPFEL